MCRFLLAKGDLAVPSQRLFDLFALMAERSRAPGGDRQEDGWGACWTSDGQAWEHRRSLRPVWRDWEAVRLPEARILLLHARSASLPSHRNRIDFNQPFRGNGHVFVFNGWLRGVSLQVEGEIGSQKIWRLLSAMLRRRPPVEALERLSELVIRSSAGPRAMNVGLSDGRDIYALGASTPLTDYYTLWTHRSNGLALVSSEPLDGLSFEPLSAGGILRL